MIDATAIEQLMAMLHRERRSLLQYIREVSAWVRLRDTHAMTRLREIATTELEVLERISRIVQKQIGNPVIHSAFPDFTPYNDVGLSYLMPILIREQKHLLAALESDEKFLPDEVFPLVDEFLKLKRAHAQQLEELHPGAHTFTTATC